MFLIVRFSDGQFFINRICADAHNLLFKDSSLTFSLSLLEHLQNPSEHIKELYRVLKKGGKAIIQLPNLQYLFEPHSKWPLLWLLPESFQSRIFSLLNYPYVNMKVTIKSIYSEIAD